MQSNDELNETAGFIEKLDDLEEEEDKKEDGFEVIDDEEV